MKRRAANIYDESGNFVPPDSAYARRLSDLKAATNRIGQTSSERLRWVIQFATTDRSQWHTATRAVDGDCLLALSGHGVTENCLGGIPLSPPLDDDELARVHGEVGNLLKQAVSAPAGEPIYLPTEGLRLGLVRMSPVGQKPAAWGLVSKSSSPAVAVLHSVRDLIFTEGRRLIPCKFCAKPILVVRKQQYCDARCSQKARNDTKARIAEQRSAGRSKGRGHGKTTRTR